MKGEQICFFLTAHVPRGEKPTVAGGVDAFQKGTLGLEADDAVPLAVERLQPGEDAGIQLCKPVIPHVQLGHVPEQVRLIWDHAGDLIQPDRAKQRLRGRDGDLSSTSRNKPQNTGTFHGLYSLCYTHQMESFPVVHTKLKHMLFLIMMFWELLLFFYNKKYCVSYCTNMN